MITHKKAFTANTVLTPATQESYTFNGVNRSDRAILAEHLEQVLADTYAIYLKTQNLHWNVVGPLFFSIHKLTEEQYSYLAQAIDDTAERIRVIGFPAPASFKKYSKLTVVEEIDAMDTNVEKFVSSLVTDHEHIAKNLRAAVSEAEDRKDVKTADMLTNRIGFHEESAWMLRSIVTR